MVDVLPSWRWSTRRCPHFLCGHSSDAEREKREERREKRGERREKRGERREKRGTNYSTLSSFVSQNSSISAPARGMSKRAGLHVGQSEDPVKSVEANGSAKSSLDDGGQAKDKAATAGGGGGRGGAVQGGIFMALLALQYGLQPILARKCVRPDLVVITQVIATEFSKIIFSTTIILLQGTAPQILRTWTLRSALLASALPASIYALQNTLVQIAYRHLDYLTFSMLNQTKLLFTAFFNFFILRSRQSPRHMAALLVMLVAAVLLTTGQDSGKSKGGEAGTKQGAEDFFLGVVSVMAASVLSGLASSICQWVVQVGGHSSYVMTIEMSVISIPVLLFSLFQTSDGEKVKTLGFFHGWTPAAMNAIRATMARSTACASLRTGSPTHPGPRTALSAFGALPLRPPLPPLPLLLLFE
eukprot:TRINITY_DN513_c0_g1_i1.p1 TRINITY_DN513_c0_g1~~TRINITY_DN513_c0_g1_i1.p1  ORF type:complete len:415 (-),score=98.57 TRINITY_DN513_c0_g1_i1:348-1592(-)